MKQEFWSVWVACSLGALIGAFTALQIGSWVSVNFIWIVSGGALLGGAIAWIAVDFRHFCAGVSHSYHNTIITWRPNRPLWTAYFTLFAGIAMVFFSALIGGAIIDGICWGKPRAMQTLIWTGVSLAGMAIFFTTGIVAPWAKMPAQHIRDVQQLGRYLMRRGNPLGVMFYSVIGIYWVVAHIPLAIMKGIPATIRGMSHAIRMFARFIAGVFMYVHSSQRTLCFADAAIGATMGFFIGNAIVGAVIGGILGLVNYEMVAVRLLGLSPKR